MVIVIIIMIILLYNNIFVSIYQSDEERELATIFLQQVLRGRSVQNMMFEGKEKRMELIQELRSTHALQGAGQQGMNEEKMAALQLQKQQQLFQQKVSHIQPIFTSLSCN